MITSVDNLLHIRTYGCRHVSLRDDVRSSSANWFFCDLQLTQETSVHQDMLLSFVSIGPETCDVSDITHKCPSSRGSAKPMYIPLRMI
ncbi:hypothetical protein TNCT_183921 [Trichonephila clavata]|uniref:Uncharacterized protein n=1 Tax=Trichonephila clavata TaxID=2740835 RepID=A0A8X6FL76_TRICU|nr:hypothetical protein TNCT_183921 [Trichonephila clavata]